MSKEKLKKAIDEIKVDEEVINKTRKKIKEIKGGNIMSSRKRSFLALACSLTVILVVMVVLTRVSDAPAPIYQKAEEVSVLPKVETLEKLKEILEKNSSGTRSSNPWRICFRRSCSAKCTRYC